MTMTIRGLLIRPDRSSCSPPPASSQDGMPLPPTPPLGPTRSSSPAPASVLTLADGSHLAPAHPSQKS